MLSYGSGMTPGRYDEDAQLWDFNSSTLASSGDSWGTSPKNLGYSEFINKFFTPTPERREPASGPPRVVSQIVFSSKNEISSLDDQAIVGFLRVDSDSYPSDSLPIADRTLIQCEESSSPQSFHSTIPDHLQYTDIGGSNEELLADSQTSSSSSSSSSAPPLIQDDTALTFSHPLPAEKSSERRIIRVSQQEEFAQISNQEPYLIPQIRGSIRRREPSRFCTGGIARVYALSAMINHKLPSSRLKWIPEADWENLLEIKDQTTVRACNFSDNKLTIVINELYYRIIHQCINQGFEIFNLTEISEPVCLSTAFRWWSDKSGLGGLISITNRQLWYSIEQVIKLPCSISNHPYIKHLSRQGDLSPLLNEINNFFQSILSQFDYNFDEIAKKGFFSPGFRFRFPKTATTMREVFFRAESEMITKWNAKWLELETI
jgi:hypothetical protein